MKNKEDFFFLTKEDIEIGSLIVDKFGDNFLVLKTEQNPEMFVTLMTRLKNDNSSTYTTCARISPEFFVEYTHKCFFK